MESGRAIAHLNIIGFRAEVAALEDPSLRGRPYVIAGSFGGRAIALDMSSEAIGQNIRPGMILAAAERLVRDLRVVAPDPAACKKANAALESVIGRYAPAWQNDGIGNLYLDISGTRNLFGPPANCVCRIQNEIAGNLGIRAAAATASNKLVSKVASRAIRPLGLIDVRPGDEAAFLARQDITLLPGLGPSLMKTIRATGFREAGELAALSDGETSSLFGKKGIFLRDIARGIDNSPVSAGHEKRTIERRSDFSEDVIDETLIAGALVSMAEHGGLEMRNDKLGTRGIRIALMYSDGIEAQGFERTQGLLVTDSELIAAALGICKKTVKRRIRIRSIYLGFEDLAPLAFQPDLFEPEAVARTRLLQKALDSIRERYGAGAVTRAASVRPVQ